ncbi:hybrid sensor histidine kinase/response regulator [Kushneria phosphatilytica]|uniref:histidine kinase n=1 Tax=Kushneria phosphatilytica TaxID=657387 RepID=A0A1S1P306_9GAMM|nr:hybrid sensor histidine kinase/response regulator [Kushneria phosphatilytica]OHV13459.1 hybrid sensor histidine kinase/response regulator [Kushneria phosphatilytica]QEL10545.1 hybrid sensor histidine kinase/response regulator [Kushneria phosphatilytica]
MFQGWLLIAISIGYIAALFLIAWWGDRRARLRGPARRRPMVYSLALAVYCTSWTFYGSVGQAAKAGLPYASIFIGPILAFLLFWPVLAKMIRVAKRQNVTSIADFIASRHGKSQALAAFTSLVALVGALPYVALQLKAMAASVTVLTVNSDMVRSPLFGDTALYVAILMALFAILFGTRHTDATEHHEGLIQAIAFESIIKLVAFLVLGIVITWGMFGGLDDLSQRAWAALELNRQFSETSFGNGFWTQTLLAMLAVFCVPRQFHVTVLENTHGDDSARARWLFPLYMLASGFFVLPLASAGLSLFGHTGISPDEWILHLPMATGSHWLTLLTFVGGFAAASGMVIMAGVTLAIMLSNELVIPLLLRLKWFDAHRGDYARWVLRTRRLIMVLIMALAYGFYRLVAESSSLAALGWLSLSALAQLAPALIGGLYWKRGNRLGVSVGMTLGFAIWSWTLLVPALARAGLLPETLVTGGPFGIALLSPLHLFGLALGDPLTHGVLLSLGVNLFCYIFISQVTDQRVVERIQASLFVDSVETRQTSINRPWRGSTSVGDLQNLCKRFLSEEQVERAFERYASQNQQALAPGSPASIDLIQFSERLLSSAIGASSARIVVNSALSGRDVAISDVVSIVDEASQVLEFNRALLQATIENVAQGIMVVDHNLQMVVWNQRYLELFDFPDNLIRVGVPIDRIFRYNAHQGEYGPGDPEEHVNLLIDNIRTGQPHHYQRYRQDGTVIDVEGNPMPGGGFVYTYQDITSQKRTEEALIRSENNIRIYTDNVPALIAYFDRDCHYLFTNRAYESVMGIDRLDAIGKRAEEVMSPVMWRERAPWMLRALAGERVSWELSMTDGEGGTRYLLATYTPHFREGQRVLGFFALYQDITERRLAEIALKETNEHLEERVRERTQALSEVNEALRQENQVRAEAESALRQAKQVAETANTSKTRFLAAASHDLLQPLNAARLFTSALSQRLEETEHSGTLEHIDNSLQAAEELLGTLLDISKLDSGALTPRRQVFALEEIFRPLRAEFEVMAADRGLDLDVVETRSMVDSDPQMLRRIIQNFLSNALRYTQQGRVLLGCRRHGEQLTIEVWDTGPGIPETKQEEIFQEFRRLDQTSRHRESEKGLGLGLSIADRMARVLEHPIRIRSWLGRGTVFSLTVPWQRGQRAETGRSETARPHRAANKLKGARILCIDNENMTLEGMKAMLEGWDCEVYTATSIGGSKSVLRNLDGDPDAILADYHLDNEITGLMALEALGERFSSEVPGIVITADRTDEVAEEVKLAGYHLLMKPVRPAALRALLTRTLQARRHTSATPPGE